MDLFLTNGNMTEIFLRVTVAVILGAMLGTERIMARKTAGMRTYSLVSMGSAVFVIISIIVSDFYIDKTTMDPLRVASQIIAGVGFIGAGLIIFRGSKISGLTTAAGLWVAAGIGMASGFGLYYIAVFVALITLVIFTVFWYIEKKIKKLSGGYILEKEEKDDEY
jgi:putative Mg2+ transporter-C (MgtC) family protein